jgi:hypothetical protein
MNCAQYSPFVFVRFVEAAVAGLLGCFDWRVRWVELAGSELLLTEPSQTEARFVV